MNSKHEKVQMRNIYLFIQLCIVLIYRSFCFSVVKEEARFLINVRVEILLYNTKYCTSSKRYIEVNLWNYQRQKLLFGMDSHINCFLPCDPSGSVDSALECGRSENVQ